MCNIKDVCCNLVSVKWSIASWMSSKLEPVTWLRVLVTLAYMKGRIDVRTYVVRHGYKTKFSHIDGLPYFLKYGAPRARAFGARGAPLQDLWRTRCFLNLSLKAKIVSSLNELTSCYKKLSSSEF